MIQLRWAEPRWLARTGSTNVDLAAAARDGAPAGSVLVAERQDAGRGRLDRSWTTDPDSGVAISVLVEPVGLPVARWPWISLLTGLAVLDAAAAVPGTRPLTLKWPNDVLLAAPDVEPGKVAGILAERVVTPTGPMAVVGVGLNLQVPGSARGSGALGIAVARRRELVDAVLVALAARLGAALDAAGNSGAAGAAGAGGDPGPADGSAAAWARLRREYTAACSTVGRPVRALLPDGSSRQGTATDVDEHGRLVVDTGGDLLVLGAGDVVHVRPSG